LPAGHLVFDGPARDLDESAIREIFGSRPETGGPDVELAQLPEPVLVPS